MNKQTVRARRKYYYADRPEWVRRGNSIVVMISGCAFLGVMLAQMPGAIVGAIVGAIFGWVTSKPHRVLCKPKRRALLNSDH